MFGDHITGIYEKAFSTELSWKERFALAKELGFDYVELSIDETDERIARLDWTEAEAEAFRRLAWDAGLRFYSMCLSAHRKYPFGSRDPQVREKAYAIMGKAIDLADWLGIKVIQLAGYDVYYEPSTQESVRLFKEGMQWSAQAAARKQIMLGMEIMDTPFLNSITKFKGYEGLVNSPWFKVYPDIGNLSAWPENDPSRELRSGRDCIVGVHLKDTKRVTDTFGGQFRDMEFGTGDVDFQSRFYDLMSIGYTGPFMVEMWHQKGQDDAAAIRKAVEYLTARYAAAREMADKCREGANDA